MCNDCICSQLMHWAYFRVRSALLMVFLKIVYIADRLARRRAVAIARFDYYRRNLWTNEAFLKTLIHRMSWRRDLFSRNLDFPNRKSVWRILCMKAKRRNLSKSVRGVIALVGDITRLREMALVSMRYASTTVCSRERSLKATDMSIANLENTYADLLKTEEKDFWSFVYRVSE